MLETLCRAVSYILARLDLASSVQMEGILCTGSPSNDFGFNPVTMFASFLDSVLISRTDPLYPCLAFFLSYHPSCYRFLYIYT